MKAATTGNDGCIKVLSQAQPTVAKEKQADRALVEIAEEIFNRHLNTEPTHVEQSTLAASREMATSPKDKVFARQILQIEQRYSVNF